ncbi:myosin-like protein [Achlya hypogyna]|uniref:Myosin-like protein n=1 Tax=Achlya hypogyna TaxID=1202772 RepID=A0A1V9YE10_ACHHY|nr:myosin-like protein [Achlya hypogyna]
MDQRFRVDSSASSDTAETTAYVDRPEQWVWCPDDTLVAIPGVIVAKEANNMLVVHTEDGEERQLDLDEALPVCMDLSMRVPDVAELFLNRLDAAPDADGITERLYANLTSRNESQAQALEHSLLYTLRSRYRNEHVYTECGSNVLLSLNPKRPVPLYTPDRIRAYRHRQTLHELPPHLFGLAEDAMRALHESGDDQAIVLLGESGAGKSEAAKLILQYLCHHEQSRAVRAKSRSNASEGSSSTSSSSTTSVHIPVEEQILHAVAVLEAFGHVSLPHNANASRVVKLTSVDYDSHGRLLAGNITTYGLEKARVVQSKERTFHIFHYLLAEASMNPTLADILDVSETVFATTSPFAFAPGELFKADATKYHDVVASLSALRVPAHHVQNMMKVLAVILHLGNVMFVPAVSNPNENPTEASCVVLEASAPSLTKAAALLEVEASVLDHYFRTRKMVTSTNQSSLKIVSVSQASRARDTFCKNLYEALFNAIVYRMNASLRSKVERYEKSNIMVENRGIHVLDGFGFETVADPASTSLLEDTLLHVNVQGVETLHAHYWSEKARAYYLSRVFESPTQSGPPLDPFKYVRLYEAPPAGIYVVLNEHMVSKTKQAHDAHFVNKLLVANDNIGNASLQPVLPSATNKKNYKLQFLVHHSAGSIVYEADDMARKNNKSVSTTAAAILKSSRNSFVKGLVDRHGNSPTHAAPAAASHVRIAVNFNAIKQNQPDTASIATDLVQQATALFDGLGSMGQHFVVCLNPSPTLPEVDPRYLLRQLRSFQVLALMHAAQRSLTVQMTPPHFFARYRHLCGHRNTLESLVRSLTAIGVLEDLTWRVDATQVWLTLLQRKKLEKVREVCLNANATMLQRNLQRGVYRRLCQRRLASLRSLRAAMTARDRAGITQGLLFARSWVEDASIVRVLAAAQALLHQVEEESYLTSLLQDATAMEAKIVLQFALHTAATVSPAWKPELLKKATSQLRLKTVADAATTALRQAVLASPVDPTRLMTLLSEQEGRATDERQLATAVMIRALETKQARDAMLALPAKAGASPAEWTAALHRAIGCGLGGEVLALLDSAYDAWGCLRAQAPADRVAVDAALTKAIARQSVTAIEACLGVLAELGDAAPAQLAEAQAVMEKVFLKPSQERAQAIELIELAVEAEHPLLLAAALKRCKAVGMASWDANVKRATQAFAAVGKATATDDVVWRQLLARDLAAVRAHDPPTPTAVAIADALDAHAAAVDAVAAAPAGEQLEKAAQLGVLAQFSGAVKDTFRRLDAVRNVDALRHIVALISGRLGRADEVRSDMLTLLSSQTQLVQSHEVPGARAVLDDAAAIAKRLQRALAAKAKLEKLLQAPASERLLAKAIDEARDASVDSALLLAAHDVLRKLSVVDEAEAPVVETIVTSTELAAFPRLRAGVDESPPPVTWEYRALDAALLLDVAPHHAVYLNRCILGYMRDRVMGYREMLAQSILQVGLEHSHLVDEILAQLLKQLSGNPRRESVRRGWDLLALCLTCLQPSPALRPFVEAFVAKHLPSTATDADADIDVNADVNTDVDDAGSPLDQRLAVLKAQGVARYCQARLQGDAATEATGFLPSVAELVAFDTRPPFVARIELLDGTVLTTDFPVSPELSVTNVVQVCAHFLGLHERLARLLGLAVVSDEAPDAKWCHPQAYLSDVYYDPRAHPQRTARHRRFVLKIRMLPPMPLVDDELFRRLLYLQAMEDVVGGQGLPFQQSEPLVRLAAYAVLIDTYPDAVPASEEELLDMNVYDYLPAAWHVEKTEEEWAELIWAQLALAAPLSLGEWQLRFMDEMRKHRLYGCHFFCVRRSATTPASALTDVFDVVGNGSVIVGVNGHGVHFLKDDAVVLSWEHADVAAVGGKGAAIALQTTQAALVGVCDDADLLRQLLHDYSVWHASAPYLA